METITKATTSKDIKNMTINEINLLMELLGKFDQEQGKYHPQIEQTMNILEQVTQ